MFVSDRLHLPVSAVVARARLAGLLHGPALLTAARAAYGAGAAPIGTGLVRPAPTGLVMVHFRDLVERGGAAVVTLRWEAAGPGGPLFPALDADIALNPAGPEAVLLTLDGAYRPPFGAGLDSAVAHQLATATVRSFTSQLGQAIAHPAVVVRPQEPRP